MKLSKAKKAEILEQRFPEFYKLSKELTLALDVVMMELQEKLDKIEEIEDLQDDLEERKAQLEM